LNSRALPSAPDEVAVYRFREHLGEAALGVTQAWDQTDQRGAADLVYESLFAIAGDARPILFQHPPSEASFSVTVAESSILRFSTALSPEVWRLKRGDGVQFAVYVHDGRVRGRVFSEYIDPKNLPSHRRWNDHQVHLAPWAGQTITLTFATGPGPNGNSDYDWAGWAEPRIVQPVAYDLLSALPEANYRRKDSAHIYEGEYSLGQESRAVLMQRPASRVTYRVQVPERAGLRFGLGIDPVVWSAQPEVAGSDSGTEYAIYVRDPARSGQMYSVFQKTTSTRYIRPLLDVDDRRWSDHVVDLGAYAGRTVDLILETRPIGYRDPRNNWAGWSRPLLVANDMALFRDAPPASSASGGYTTSGRPVASVGE
jgi:hypothetical protein